MELIYFISYIYILPFPPRSSRCHTISEFPQQPFNVGEAERLKVAQVSFMSEGRFEPFSLRVNHYNTPHWFQDGIRVGRGQSLLPQMPDVLSLVISLFW